MDKGIRHISAIRGDKHWPYRPYLEGLWPCGFFFMVALTSLGACGGGGSGSASSSQGVAVTEPPAIRQVARVPLLFGESYQSEYARQSGLHFTQTALGGQIRIGHQVKPRGQDHALSASWKMSF